MSFDSDIRYFHAHLGGGLYGVEEGKSHELVDPGPYTYEEALKLADYKNERRAYERIQYLADREGWFEERRIRRGEKLERKERLSRLLPEEKL